MSAIRRIAFVCPRFSEGGTVGGAETLLKALAERAAGAGVEVTMLTTCARNHFTWANEIPPGRQTFGNLTVHFFPVNEDRDIETFLRVQGQIDKRIPVTRSDEEAWIGNSVNSRELCRHLEEEGDGYDRIILGPYLFGVVYAAAAIHPEKTFLVPCLHDEAFAYLSIMRDLFHKVQGLMFNTVPEMKLARGLYELPEDRCTVVGMGIDDYSVEEHAFSENHGLNQPYVLYSGRREPLKGTPLLCEYMHVFRQRTRHDIKLVFTGSGDIEAPEGLQPHILDAGFVTENEKHEAMAGAAAFIHPSINESLGIVLLESWLGRTPGIVHDRCEVLKDQCRRSGGGLWFRYYPEFEESLLRLVEDRNLNRAMGHAGRAFVRKEYAWPEVEKRLFAALGGQPSSGVGKAGP